MAGRRNSVDVFLSLHGQRKFSKELATSGAQLEAMGVKGAKSIAAFAATGDKLKKFGSSWTRHVTLPVTVGAVLAGKAAVDWESSFAGVRKTVDATEKQYASMEKGIRSMSLHIPVAANDLAGIAEAAGQLGIKRRAILGFTRVIADLGVATNLAGDEGATILARFANITQMPQSQFDRLGSTIVALGNAGASTEKDIAAMGLRIAAAGDFVGMSEAHILGFANALSSMGIEAEAGGTSISQVMKTVNSAVMGGGSELESFAQIAGVSGGKFAKSWKRDAAGTLVGWIEGLDRLKRQGKDVPDVLGDLNTKLRGTRVQDTLLRASGAGDLLRESLSLGAKSWKENNALTEEAEKRYKTVASRLQILKNKFIDAGVSLGQELLPPLIQFVEFAGPKVGAIAEAFGALPGPVKATALGLLILTGPVASGLGFFASGMGRILIMTGKVGKAMSIFNATLSSSVMTEQSGVRGAFGAAFKGTGAASALQAAKGFAWSLGPAIAAYGIGNIVSSVVSGDMRDAGYEIGGAVAGGIAGFLIGGPLGAMIGVGIGSLGGELVEKLLNPAEKIPPLQEKLARSAKTAKAAFEDQVRASDAMSQAGGRIVKAHHRQRAAVQEVKALERALTDARQRFGVNSRPALKAELGLARAGERRARAIRAVREAERLKGVDRAIVKETARFAELEGRNRIKLLSQEVKGLLVRRKQLKQEGASWQRLKPVNAALLKAKGELATADKKLSELYGRISKQIGPDYVRFLKTASKKQLELGRTLKDVLRELRKIESAMKRLSEMDTAPFKPGAVGESLRNALEKARGEARELAPPKRRHGGAPPKRKGGGGAGTSSIGVPRARRVKPSTDGINFRSAFGGGDRPIVVQSILDGKVIAESTARLAENEAAVA